MCEIVARTLISPPPLPLRLPCPSLFRETRLYRPEISRWAVFREEEKKYSIYFLIESLYLMYSEVMKSFTAQASLRGASNHGFRKGGKEAKVQPIDVREGPKMAPRCLGFLALQLKYVHNFLVLSVSPRYATLTSLLRDLICRVLVKSRGITEAGSGVSQFCKTYRSTKAIRCE